MNKNSVSNAPHHFTVLEKEVLDNLKEGKAKQI